MDIQQYVPLAVLTKSDYYDGSIANRFIFDALHCSMGAMTEIIEYINAGSNEHLTVEQNQIEELGDIIWYLAIGIDLVKDQPIYIKANNEHIYVDDVTVYGMLKFVGEMLDVCKRTIYYRKEFDSKRFIYNLMYATVAWHKLAGDNASDIMKKNIDKLAKRYGGKFEFNVLRDYGIEAEVFKC